MNRLILIGILWCLAIAIGSAQETLSGTESIPETPLFYGISMTATPIGLPGPPHLPRTEVPDVADRIAQLRTDYEAANKQAHDLAESLRQTPDAAKKAELRTAVQRAFTLRQSLLRTELQEMQARLEKTQQSLDMRDRMVDQIVDRRVEDLLNPQLEWDDEVLIKTTSTITSTLTAPTKPKTTASTVAELDGDWHRMSASGEETPHFNITIYGSTWTQFVDGKPEAIELLCDTTRKTIEFKSTPPLVYTYEFHGDSLILHNETQTQAFNRGHRLPPDVTELEGDWRQMSSSTDRDGKPLAGGYATVSFRKNQYTHEAERGQHRCRVDVISSKKEIRYFHEGEYNFFVQDHYILEGDQLTIYDENRRTIYRRVKERRPKPTRQATDEQKSWRVTYDDLDLLKILNLEPVPANAIEHFPDWLQELNGKTVRIRGFMYPAFESSGLKEFTLARDNGLCTFVRDPKIYEVIGVTLDEGVTTDYIASRPFDVEGMFHIEPKTDEGTLTHLYRISGARILPVAAEDMDPQSEDLSKAQSNEVNDHPMQITGSTNSVANALAKLETAGPVTELEGDWHRVAYIDKWQTERRPINMTIRANQETATLWTGESYSRTVVIDQNAKTIEIEVTELKGGLPNQVVSERGTYALSEDLLTIHSEYTISDSVSGSVIQKGQHTNIWKRGLCKIENYDGRNPGHGMGICHLNGDDENTGLGKLLPGDNVDVLVSFVSKDDTTAQRILVENIEVDGSSEPTQARPAERQLRLLGTREQCLVIDDANMRGVTLSVSRKLDGKTQQFPGGINTDAVKEVKEVAPRKNLDVSEPTPFP